MRGSATESFARKGRELYHGNQLLALQFLDYDPDIAFRQSNHTLANIVLALDRIFETGTGRLRAKQQMADYLVFDALIGNTDRHHENWGVLYRQTETGWTKIVAPTFDHASSLGRELRDERRERLLFQRHVGRYSEKARGAIFWSQEDTHALSPLNLIRGGVAAYPDLFRSALKPLRNLDRRILDAIIQRVPADWMSDLARTFAVELMCYNLDQLLMLKA